MTIQTILDLLGSTAELGLISGLTVLSLFLSYSMLGVCDLSTDGCFTLGATVGAVVAVAGHPYLSLVAAMAAGAVSGFVTAFLQTKMGINSLLSGIIVNTALYSVNIAIMGGASLINLNKVTTVFTDFKELLAPIGLGAQNKLFVGLVFAAAVAVLLGVFLKTRLGYAIRATGDNPIMVSSSSINPHFTTIIGLTVSGSITALSGCLLAQMQKSANIDIGTGMVTVALASLLMGGAFMSKRRMPLRLLGMLVGSFAFRLVFTIALRFDIPAFMLRAVSAVIVVIAISAPYIKSRLPFIKRYMEAKKHKC